MQPPRWIRRFGVIVSGALLAVVSTTPALATSTAGSATAARARGPVAAAACWERDYADPAGDSVPDITNYSLSFDCAAKQFTLAISSTNWPYTFGEIFRMTIFTGTNPNAGCHGSTRSLLVYQNFGPQYVGHVLATPSCDEATWSLTEDATVVVVGAFETFLVRFSPVGLGSASFRWQVRSAVAAPGHFADHFPDSGQQTASGVPYYPSASSGYWLTDAAGGVHPYGNAPFRGDLTFKAISAPIVGMAATVDHNGYWLLGRDGGVFSYGSAAFYGSTGGIRLNQPIVGMTATPIGHGYWFVASDGGIFSFGDAAFHGSTGALHLNKPIVGMTSTPSGRGYWLVASDGGIFSFGDAAFHGSTGNLHLASPIVAMTTSPTGRGYRFVASDGGIFSFGDAPFFGSLAGTPAPPVISLAG